MDPQLKKMTEVTLAQIDKASGEFGIVPKGKQFLYSCPFRNPIPQVQKPATGLAVMGNAQPQITYTSIPCSNTCPHFSCAMNVIPEYGKLEEPYPSKAGVVVLTCGASKAFSVQDMQLYLESEKTAP